MTGPLTDLDVDELLERADETAHSGEVLIADLMEENEALRQRVAALEEQLGNGPHERSRGARTQ